MPRPLRRVAFLIPSAFTLASLFCGFFAISRAFTGDREPEALHAAALAILFGAFFDAFDGRVARLTRTETELGLELDSLADIVTFGVAPAALVYHWGLDVLGIMGLVVAFGWVAAGAYRLARFNVLARRRLDPPAVRAPTHEPLSREAPPAARRLPRADELPTREAPLPARRLPRPGKFIRGLPIPPAAALLVSFLVAANQGTGPIGAAAGGSLAAVVVLLSFLMVSPFRFRSFKAVTWRSRRTMVAVAVLVAAALGVAARLPVAYVFVFLLTVYVGLGLVDTLALLPGRGGARATAPRVPSRRGL